MFGLVSRRRYNDLYERHILALKQTATARQKADTAAYNRQQVLVQNAELDATNRRLHGRLLELGRRTSALAEADPEYAAGLERRLRRVLKACRGYRAELAAEIRRADRLQARLDDALGLNAPHVRDGRYWQQTRTDKKGSTS